MSETFTPDNLIAGDFPIVTESVTVDTGVLARGTVLGKITATGKCVIVDSDGTDDGRRTAYAVLLDDVDASSADVVAAAALSGKFNEDALIFSTGDTIDTYRAGLRDIGIYVGQNQPA
jgi:hypothetical protein